MPRKSTRRISKNIFAKLLGAISHMGADRARLARSRLADPTKYPHLTRQQRDLLIRLSLRVESAPNQTQRSRSRPSSPVPSIPRPGDVIGAISARYRLPPPPRVDSRLMNSVNHITRATTPSALVTYARNVLVTAQRRARDQKPVRDKGAVTWLEAFFRARMGEFSRESREKTFVSFTTSKRHRHTEEQRKWFREILQLPME